MASESSLASRCLTSDPTASLDPVIDTRKKRLEVACGERLNYNGG